MQHAKQLSTFINSRIDETGEAVPFWEIVRFAQELDPALFFRVDETDPDMIEFLFQDDSDISLTYRADL